MDDIIILSSEEDKVTKNTSPGDHLKKDKKDIMAKLNDFVAGFGKVKTKEKVILYRLLATMLNAGMPLIKSIGVLEKQEKNPVLKNILGGALIGLKEGKSLSECLDEHHKSFAAAEIGIIRSGEKTGQLDLVMISLADQVEKVSSITGKLKSALIYPAMIMLVVVGVIGVMMTMVVPNLLDIFDDQSQLPPSTQILIAMSDFTVNYWFLMIPMGFAAVIGIGYWKKTPAGKYNYDSLLLKLPVFGQIVQKVTLSKFSRVFAGLLAAGVSIVESLNIVSDAVGNEVYRQRILLLLEDVRQGLKIHESLDGDTLFPDIMVQMIEVGEQTANLDKTIIKVADFYDEQVDNLAGTINKLLEPFIIVFLAVVVGFIAIAIMQPIMELADTVAGT
ncbi:type II secretion system F family protein [Candidatus Gracilibacteria bacterium]|nr:type II secretion system F family protein [Candidatus Gracilibacteria bacterium]